MIAPKDYKIVTSRIVKDYAANTIEETGVFAYVGDCVYAPMVYVVVDFTAYDYGVDLDKAVDEDIVYSRSSWHSYEYDTVEDWEQSVHFF